MIFSEETLVEIDKKKSKLGNKDIIMFFIRDIPIIFWFTLLRVFSEVLFTLIICVSLLKQASYVCHMVP